MVKFDTLSDARFLSSLQDLGLTANIEVLRTLDEIAQRSFTWSQFVDAFGWQPLNLQGQDTFPGAMQLHEFAITTVSNHLYRIVGYTQENIVVVCAIAR